jgi:hypothetical protein
MLAMEAGTTRAFRQPVSSLTSIASMLAPTVLRVIQLRLPQKIAW